MPYTITGGVSNGGTVVNNGITYNDDIYAIFGTGVDTEIGYNTTQTPDSWFFGVGADSRGIVIAEKADVAFDFAHGLQTNPTLFIHSAAQSTTQWLGLAHDGTNGIISTGTGQLVTPGVVRGLGDGNSDLGAVGVRWANVYAINYVMSSGGVGDTSIARHSAGVIAVRDDTASSIRSLLGGGAAVASATALPLPTGNVFHVTGTTTITSITSTNFEAGVVITLIFDGVLTFTDGVNLKLAGNFVTTADDTITLVYDGTNWYEIARSIN